MRYFRPPVQLLRFDLSSAAPDPSTFDLTAAVAGVVFQARAVRVVSSTAMLTTLLVGGLDTTSGAANPGVLIYISIAVGSSSFTKIGSVALPSFGSGVTALSQTSPLLPGYVLASTDEGVFKCVDLMQSPVPADDCFWDKSDAVTGLEALLEVSAAKVFSQGCACVPAKAVTERILWFAVSPTQ